MASCLTTLANNPPGVDVGRHLTRLVNHPSGMGEPSDRHAAGRLSNI